MYDDAQYANSRLTGTYVRTDDNRPVMVHECAGEGEAMEVRISFVDNPKDRRQWVLAKKLNYRSMPLGYMNMDNNKAFYLSRIPRRDDWRQGLRDNQLTTRGVLRIGNHGKALADMLAEKYPSYKACVKRFIEDKEGMVRSQAFSRFFAVQYMRGGKNLKLMYKGKYCGVINSETYEIDLKEGYKHLKERLEASL